jgi:replicative DNA helicase
MAYEFQESIQRGIVYLAKSDDNFLVQAMPMVKESYFEFPQHQKFWRVINSHYTTYKKLPSDEQILEQIREIKTDNELMSDFKEELTEINGVDEKSLENEEFYLDKVEEFAKEQSLKDAIINSIDLLKQKKFGRIEEQIREALSVSRDVDLGTDYFGGVAERYDRLNNAHVNAQFRTPFETINQELEGGLAPKELAMVVAPPGVGKSLFLANQCARSVMDGKDVLYVSLEMSEDRVAQRLDSIFTRIKQSELKTGVKMLEDRLDQMKAAAPNMGRLKIKEFPTKRLTVTGLRAYLNQLRNYEDFHPDIIVVDYLELMTNQDVSMSEYMAQERIAQELRGIAVEHKCLVWTATQTNRKGKEVDIITDAELADSYGKIRVCDLAFSINQKEQEFDEGKARMFVMKSRNGRARYIVPIRIDYTRLVITQQ